MPTGWQLLSRIGLCCDCRQSSCEFGLMSRHELLHGLGTGWARPGHCLAWVGTGLSRGSWGWHAWARGWHGLGPGWHGLGTAWHVLGTAWHGLARAWHGSTPNPYLAYTRYRYSVFQRRSHPRRHSCSSHPHSRSSRLRLHSNRSNRSHYSHRIWRLCHRSCRSHNSHNSLCCCLILRCHRRQCRSSHSSLSSHQF